MYHWKQWNYSFMAPSINEQKRISSILSSLDSKIELNRRINDNLEQQAQALFKSWFIENAIYSGDKIADYFMPIRGKNLMDLSGERLSMPLYPSFSPI